MDMGKVINGADGRKEPGFDGGKIKKYSGEAMEYLFSKINVNTYFRRISEELAQELHRMERQMMDVNKREVTEYLVNKFAVRPLEVDFEFDISQGHCPKEGDYRYHRCMDYFVSDPEYSCNYHFPFTGCRDIFDFDIRGRYSFDRSFEEEMEFFSLERSGLCISVKTVSVDIGVLPEREQHRVLDEYLEKKIFVIKKIIGYANAIVEKQNAYMKNVIIKYVENAALKKLGWLYDSYDLFAEENPDYVVDELSFNNIRSNLKEFAVDMISFDGLTGGLDERALRAVLAGKLQLRYKGAAYNNTFKLDGADGISIVAAGKLSYLIQVGFWGGEMDLCRRLDALFSREIWPDCKFSLILFDREGKDLKSRMTQVDTLLTRDRRLYGKNEQVCEAEKLYKFSIGGSSEKKMAFLQLIILPLDGGKNKDKELTLESAGNKEQTGV